MVAVIQSFWPISKRFLWHARTRAYARRARAAPFCARRALSDSILYLPDLAGRNIATHYRQTPHLLLDSSARLLPLSPASACHYRSISTTASSPPYCRLFRQANKDAP